MQATLIFNENAGNGGGPTPDALQEALADVGFHPVYRATNREEDLDPILQNPEGLIISAGGDGTVRAVVTRLIGKEVPLAILPLGTANNISKALNMPTDPLAIIAGLKEPRVFPFDVGHVQAPWGTDYFLEGAGFGFFADILASYDPEKGKSIVRGMQAVSETMLKGFAYDNCVYLAGEEHCDEFLLVEILNTTAVGPRLKFAPDASPGDGVLDVVCIRASDRQGLLHYLASLVKEDLDKLETVTVRQVQELSFTWRGFPFHVDAQVRPPYLREQQEFAESDFGPRPHLPRAEAGEIKVKVLPGAVTLWLPPVAETEG